MTSPFSLHSHPKMREKFTVIYLVRSFRTYARIRSLTTGTFNRVVKDRIAIRLSGANSGLDGPAYVGEPTSANPAVLETLQTYVAAQDPVNPRIPQNFHGISTLGNRAWDGRPGSPIHRKLCHSESGGTPGEEPAFGGGSLQHATIWPSALDYKHADESAHAEAEDRKLRKDPIGGPCFEGTLQKPALLNT